MPGVFPVRPLIIITCLLLKPGLAKAMISPSYRSIFPGFKSFYQMQLGRGNGNKSILLITRGFIPEIAICKCLVY